MRSLLSKSAFALILATSGAHAADIEFWYGIRGNKADAVQAQCDAFNDAQSEHKVTCVAQGDYEEAAQKAIAAYRSGTHPVLVQFSDALTLDLMLSDAVVPVSEALPETNWSDVIGGARSYYETSKGELFSAPYNPSTLLLYANMEQLGEVGVTEIPTTWEGIMDVAQKLKANGHSCPFVTDGHPWRILEQFAVRHGEPIASKNNGYGGLDTQYTYNEGLVLEHMENIVAWREEGLFLLETDTEAGKYRGAFNSGECAMMEASTGSYAAAYEAGGDRVGLQIAPVYEDRQRFNSMIGGGALWIMKGHDTDKIAAAGAFIEFFLDDDQQLQFTEATGYLPVTNSAIAALKESGRAEEPIFAAVSIASEALGIDGNENSRGMRLGFFSEARSAFQEETTKAFNGEQSMREALDAAVERGNTALRRFEKTYAGKELP